MLLVVFCGIFLAYIAFSVAISIDNVSPQELDALQDFYTSTHGENWAWTEVGEIWNFDVDDPNPCHPLWQGIVCRCENSVCTIVDIHLGTFGLVGPIPDSFGNLVNVYSITLDDNLINGTLPATLGNMYNLTTIDFSENLLEGRLPDFLYNQTSRLKKISLYYNFFTGHIPEQLFNNSESMVDSLLLFDNLFTGPLPSIVLLPMVTNIDLESNLLSGTITNTLCNCSLLVSVKLNMNLVTGTIPYCIGTVQYLSSFHVNSNSLTGTIPEFYAYNRFPGQLEADINMLTGTIPESLCTMYPQYLDLGNNSLTGTLPSCLFDAVTLFYFSISYNLLSGTIPNQFLNMSFLNTFTVDNNLFTGTVPDITRMVSLEFFYVQSNKFRGRLDWEMNSTKRLSFLDVSNNQFTGTLPIQLFNEYIPLLSFAATSNCFTGHIPRELCDSKLLVFLDLDGISTGESCRTPLFKNIPLIKSFTVQNQITGGIPLCLFNMSNLNTMHLSGNSIDWSFPDDLVINDALQSLSLSHNKLTGTIPKYIQEKRWQTLDLSYNNLEGMIMSNWSFFEELNPSLILQVNRLSGGIPASLQDMPSINILSGNLFGCDFHRSSLPKHDNSYRIYQCGSNTFYQAVIVWGVCVGLVLVLLLSIYRWPNMTETFGKLKTHYLEYMAVFDSISINSALTEFKNNLFVFLNAVVGVTVVLMLVFLSVYVVLTVYYKTNDHQYAWTVSAAFISGQTPAMTLVVLYASFIVSLFFLWVVFNIKVNTVEEKVTKSIQVKQMAILSLLVLLNCIFMSLVNVGYVAIILNYSEVVIFFTQISMALFKLLWNDFCVRGLLTFGRRYYQSQRPSSLTTDLVAAENDDTKFIGQEMPFVTFIILFNCIIAPCLATAAVDRDCFYNAFVAAQPVKTEFPIYNCDMELVQDHTCTDETASVNFINIAYSPPFIYSYQCSSSILTNYAAVFVFMFLMVAFFKLIVLAVMVSYRSEVAEGSVLHILMDNTIYKLLKPANVEDVSRGEVLFFKDRFVLRMISKISVLLTFGVVFPPLAGVVCVAFFTETYLNLIMIGRFLCSVEDSVVRVQFQELVCRNVEGFERLLLMPIVSLVVPFAALFYGFFVFDTYGDEVGFKEAIWAPVLVAVVPVFVWMCYRVFRLVSGVTVDNKEELIRMSKQRDSVVVNALYADTAM